VKLNNERSLGVKGGMEEVLEDGGSSSRMEEVSKEGSVVRNPRQAPFTLAAIFRNPLQLSRL